MSDAPRLSVETLARLAVESVPITLTDADQRAASKLVGDLSAEMAAMRKLAVGKADPAAIYHANHK